MDDRCVEFMAWMHAMANECGFQFSVCVDGALFVFYMVLSFGMTERHILLCFSNLFRMMPSIALNHCLSIDTTRTSHIPTISGYPRFSSANKVSI